MRNEETAAAGAIAANSSTAQMQETKQLRASKRYQSKGVEGLARKADFSQYMDSLTEKQQLAFSLKFEYELGLAEIASRMGIDRKTAYGHIEAAKAKVDQARSGDKRKATRARSTDL